MGDYFSRVSEKVQNHLKQLSGSVKLNDTEPDPLEVLAQGWLEKDSVFSRQTEENEMEICDSFSASDNRGALIMTYSGSLISLSPPGENGRHTEYSSIGFRTDVPGFLEQDEAELSDDIIPDEPVKFVSGPIEKSSPVYRIAIIRDEMESEEADELLTQVTHQLTEDFIEINKTLISE